jgi:hypothetical protein
VRDGHVDDDDAGRDSVGVAVDSRAPRRAEVGIVRRMLMICLKVVARGLCMLNTIQPTFEQTTHRGKLDVT